MHQRYNGWISKPRQEINKYELWRGVAKMNKLSTKAQLRLEWIIFFIQPQRRTLLILVGTLAFPEAYFISGSHALTKPESNLWKTINQSPKEKEVGTLIRLSCNA